MSKQTAVEWLVEEMQKRIPTFYAHYVMNMDEVYEQAKAMEREQIIDAVSRGWWNNENGLVSWIGEEYYNETYKTKDNE